MRQLFFHPKKIQTGKRKENMTCRNPQWIYLPKYLPIRNAQYEENQKILRKPIWHYTPRHYAIQIPCGHCINCLLDRAKDHATKCYCEMQTAGVGAFITLTYNNGYRTTKGHENELSLPLTEKGEKIYNELTKKGIKHYEIMKILAKAQEHSLDVMDLKKKDLQDFIKRLRKHLDKQDIKIRYLACGERGEDKKRVHFHIAIFGWKPEDLKKYKYVDRGKYWTYTSEILSEKWGNGFVVVGDLNFKSASYTARYIQKKAYAQHNKRKYYREFYFRHTMEECCNILNEYCTEYDKRPLTKNDYIQYFMKVNSINRIIKNKKVPEEFITMSNRPGIGLNWFLQNKQHIIDNNGILIHIDRTTKVMKCPNYFKKKWKEIEPEEFYNWAYQQQIKAINSYNKEINKLNYPKNYPEWKKELEYTKQYFRKFDNRIKNLVRINLEKDTT